MPKGIPRAEEAAVEENKKETSVDTAELMAVLQGVASGMENIQKNVNELATRVSNIEDGGANKFKQAARKEDIESASETRKNIDPKISNIVDEMLGTDFGVEVKPLGDRPGFRFSVLVPQRLSDNVLDKRPVIGEDGKYQKDASGNVVMEDYYPDDRRSRIISSLENYDGIKNHCEKVRGYIVSYFQKQSKPLPEFKVR